MKRYFGTTSSTLAGITSVVRTSTGITINGTENISLWTRSDSTAFPVGYNYIYSKDRQVALLPESTSSNTLITSDGLILVINGTDITVADIFEEGNIPFDNIVPVDYDALLEYASGINPEHKRIFVISGKDGSNNLIVKNNEIYTASGVTYFQTDMDLELTTDSYGYYGITSGSFSETTITFSLVKKQFYLLEAPAGTDMYVDGSLKSPISGTNFYRFDDLDIGLSKYITFNLRNSSASSGTIIIY